MKLRKKPKSLADGPILPVIAALFLLIVLWWPLSVALSPFLPSPLRVAQALISVTTDAELYEHFSATLQRIAIGSTTAFFIGSMLAIPMGRSRIMEFMFLPWILIGLSIPTAAAALASILFLGLDEYASLLALWVIVTPYVVNVVYQGARSIDPKLLEAAQIYRFSTFQKVRHVMVPHMAPSLLAGARLAFAFSWKSVVIIEALTRPNGIGSKLTFFFKILRAENVIAYTLTFNVVMLAVELLFFRSIDRRAFRWRTRTVSL